MNEDEQVRVINPWAVLAWSLNVATWLAAPAGLAILWRAAW
ncbi:hypothetical protein ACFWH7_03430 [Cellulosimicrobium cellulans]